ncbi:unnamed protein product, partial [marine sediment metagenome]
LGAGLSVAALFWVAELYRRSAALTGALSLLGERSERDVLSTPMLLTAHGIAILLLTLEANDFFSLRVGAADLPGWMKPADARGMSFSVIWTLYAIGMVVAGFVREVRPIRLMALLVLTGTVVKVFLLDLGFLEGLYRVLSFFVLGVMLVGVSFLYQRFRHVLVAREAQGAPPDRSEHA